MIGWLKNKATGICRQNKEPAGFANGFFAFDQPETGGSGFLKHTILLCHSDEGGIGSSLARKPDFHA